MNEINISKTFFDNNIFNKFTKPDEFRLLLIILSFGSKAINLKHHLLSFAIKVKSIDELLNTFQDIGFIKIVCKKTDDRSRPSTEIQITEEYFQYSNLKKGYLKIPKFLICGLDSCLDFKIAFYLLRNKFREKFCIDSKSLLELLDYGNFDYIKKNLLPKIATMIKFYTGEHFEYNFERFSKTVTFIKFYYFKSNSKKIKKAKGTSLAIAKEPKSNEDDTQKVI
jgi:hypothetical protein